MTDYALYLESGPRQKKTMVHVLDLLGCIVRGPTTPEAVEATPTAIRQFVRFLHKHGDAVDPDAPFTTSIAAHVMDGAWLGEGNPTPGFAPDFEPLGEAELGILLQRLSWVRDGFSEVLGMLAADQLIAQPTTGGRPIARIIEHVVEADAAYLRSTVGKVDGLLDATRAVLQLPQDLPSALAALWRVGSSRLATMTEDERTRIVPHGQVMWTARRGLRRMLEHQWEHLVEVSTRLERPVV